MRVAPPVVLTQEQRNDLERFARGRSAPARLVRRAKIVLLASEGVQNKDIALRLQTRPRVVGIWRRRFIEQGIEGLKKDASRPGRRPKIPRSTVQKIVNMTLHERPKNATHWSTRTMARSVNVSEATVRRIWHAHGLKPHRVKTFKLSNDPQFTEKLEDVIGLYLNPPEHALVLCADEKSQIQALDRSQPGLPLKKGRCGTMTHDYKRHGTTTLFAALNTLDGNVIGTCMQKHRHQEWLRFLNLIDEQTPPDKQIHLIQDNYSTHKHPKVKAWQKRHPRFHFHFVPTSSSWLNMVERFFRDLTSRRIRRGIFHSVDQLIEAITEYLNHHNADPKPFVWTATASDILEKVKRARKAARFNAPSV